MKVKKTFSHKSKEEVPEENLSIQNWTKENPEEEICASYKWEINIIKQFQFVGFIYKMMHHLSKIVERKLAVELIDETIWYKVLVGEY